MVDILFRYRWTLLSLLGLLTLGFAAYFLLVPRVWEAETTFLVKNAAAATGDSAAESPDAATEVQLLQSSELAGQIVDAAQLGGTTAATRTKAIADFKKDLQVTPLGKSNLIRLHYSSIAPARSARVLELLSKAYLDRHQQLIPVADPLAFLNQQTAESDRQLANARERLLQFHRRSGVTDATAEKNLYLRKMVDLQSDFQKAETENADTVRRVDALKARLEQIPSRISTGNKQIPNQFSVERLALQLNDLRNRRAELLTTHRPTDREVAMLDLQIANTAAALEVAERTSANEESTGVNPLRQALEKELETAQPAAAGLAERMLELRAQKEGSQRELSRLESLIPAEQDFLRDEKAADAKYMLYAQKREETRLDAGIEQPKTPIVTVVDPPHAPVRPMPRFTPSLLGAYLFGWPLALLVVFVRNQWRRSAFTPWALDGMTSLPVLGTVPARAGATRRRS